MKPSIYVLHGLSWLLAFAMIGAAAQAPSTNATPPGSSAKSPGAAVGLMVYPSKGQAAELQLKDETECYSWAQTQSGYDPASPAPAAAAPSETAQAEKSSGADGSRLRGAARGAAAGAVIGEVANDDASEGAAIGAAAGAVAGGRQKRKAEAQQKEQAAQQAQAQQQQHAAAQQEMLDKFKSGMSVCLEARGYAVK